MEGQENRSVVIRVEHPLDGPPRELDDLEKRENLGAERNHMRRWTHSGITTWLERIARSGDGVVD